MITTNLDLVIEEIKKKEPVAIPTETVYGLAAHGLEEEAIEKVFLLKQRPSNHPLILHVHPDWDLSPWVKDIPQHAQTLIKNFWPGPLTLIFKAKSISPMITGGQDTLAIRCPNHPLALNLLAKLGAPLVAPSANPFGKISPTTAQHVEDSFGEKGLLILDGGRCLIGIESTIVTATEAKTYQILRHGLLDAESIELILKQKPSQTEASLRSPGALKQHYQPQKPLYSFETPELLAEFAQKEAKAYLLSFHKLPCCKPNLSYLLPTDPKLMAYELYYQLRKADQSMADCIGIELPPDEKAWWGLRERLLKASSRHR